MQQQLLLDPIYSRKKLKKIRKIKKSFKKNPKIKIGQFSISAWLEARFPSYSQKLQNWERWDVALLTATEQLSGSRSPPPFKCVLIGAELMSCLMTLLPGTWDSPLCLPFICDVITMAVREQLRMWAGGRIYLYFSQAQDLDSVPDSLEQNCICGNVMTCNDFDNGGKIPTDPVLLQWIWDKIQILCLRKA